LGSFRGIFLGRKRSHNGHFEARAGKKKSSTTETNCSFPSWVHHGLGLLVSGSKSAAVDAFLLLLHQSTAWTATRSAEIAKGGSFDAVLVTHLASLDGLEDA
jgi:hypothetical protein